MPSKERPTSVRAATPSRWETVGTVNIVVIVAVSGLVTACLLGWMAAIQWFSSVFRDRRAHDPGILVFALLGFAGLLGTIIATSWLLDALSVPRQHLGLYYCLSAAMPAVAIICVAYRRRRAQSDRMK